jgi:excisionase family DNA binding protein
METINEIKKPSKQERKLAQKSYSPLLSAIDQLKTDQAEIEIEETGEKIKLPVKALKLLGEILKAMSEGRPVSIVPIATEVTTQTAAELLGCSRPYLVKLLEEGKIEYTKVGKHRRIKYEDVIRYKQEMKEEQKKHLIDIMNADEELGLYDS